MVFAHALEADVLHQDHFIVFLRERFPQRFRRIGSQAGKHLGIHARDTVRSLAQAFAVRILTDSFQDITDRGDDPGVIDAVAGLPAIVLNARAPRTCCRFAHGCASPESSPAGAVMAS